MSGLFQKALAIRDNSTSTAWGGNGSSAKVSPEERREILVQIDELVDKSRIRVRPESFVVYPQRRGSAMPLLINAAALLTVVLGGLSFFWFFDRRQDAIVVETEQFQTAEGKLIAAIRSESEEQMAVKDREILSAQQRLSEVRAERDRIQVDSESRLQSQREQLEGEFQAELDAERARLIGLGVTGDDLTGRMRAFEQERKSEFDARLVAIQQEVDRERRERELAVAGLIADYESSLTAAQEERQRLESELDRRQAELQADLRQQEQALEADRERITAELQELASQREREQLTLDQIISFYDAVNQDLRAERYDEALADLATLRNYLDEPRVAQLPAIERRRAVETFIIASLRELIEDRTADTGDTGTLVASAELLARVGQMIEQGNEVFQEGRTEDARRLYQEAMRQIPEVRIGYERLEQIDTLAEQAEADRLAGLIQSGDSQYLAGEYQASVDRYSLAIRTLGEDRPEVELMVTRILDAGFQIYEAERPPEIVGDAETLARLQELQAELEIAQAERALVQEQLDRQRRDYQTAVAERDGLATELSRARELYESTAGEGATDQEQLDRLLTEIERLEADYRDSETGRAQTEAALEQITRDTTEAASLLEILQLSYDQLSDDLVEAEARRRTAAADLRTAEERNMTLSERLAGLQGRYDQSESDRTTAEGELAATLENAAVLAAERDEAIAQAERLRTASATGDGERAELFARVADLRSRVDETTATQPPGAQDISRLLEAKVLVKQIIGSEAVREEYPGLYRSLDDYFEVFGRQQNQLGREQALADVIAIVGNLEGRLGTPEVSGPETERTLLLRLLDSLEVLIP